MPPIPTQIKTKPKSKFVNILKILASLNTSSLSILSSRLNNENALQNMLQMCWDKSLPLFSYKLPTGYLVKRGTTK